MKATYFLFCHSMTVKKLSYFSRKEEVVALEFRKSFFKCCQIFTLFEKSSSVKDLRESLL